MRESSVAGRQWHLVLAPATVFLLLCSSHVGYAEAPSKPNAGQAAPSYAERDASRNRLEQIERDAQKLHDPVRDAQLKELAKQYFSLVEQERYEEARKVVDELQAIEPEYPAIPLMTKWVVRVQQEPDPQKRAALHMELLSDYFALLGESIKEVGQGMRELSTSLQELGPKNSAEALCQAAGAGKPHEVIQLLDKGVSPDAMWLGDPALEHASYEGHLQIVELLLSRGADVNRPGSLGVTPLMSASAGGHAEVVKTLVAHGADVNVKTKTGSTALSVASRKHYLEIVDILKKAGAKDSAE